MTKKDYVLIAGVVSARLDAASAAAKDVDSTEDGSTVSHCAAMARDFADVLERENPRFDRARFLAACGVVS